MFVIIITPQIIDNENDWYMNIRRDMYVFMHGGIG